MRSKNGLKTALLAVLIVIGAAVDTTAIDDQIATSSFDAPPEVIVETL